MRLLSICPRIRKESGRVVATTAWRVRLLSLGAVYRQVVVDPVNETVSIFSRYLWWIRFSRTIQFSEIQAVTYGYEDMSPQSLVSFAHNSYDWFSVGLRFRDDSEMRLFNFIGDGTFSNNGPFPDWVYWDEYAFDNVGSQDKESRVFVQLLSKLTRATVAPPRNF